MIAAEPGHVVRVRANDADVAPDSYGVVVYIHPESNNPVVSIGGRAVALLQDQLEVFAPNRARMEPPAAYVWSEMPRFARAAWFGPRQLYIASEAAEMLSGQVVIKIDRSRGAVAVQPVPRPVQGCLMAKRLRTGCRIVCPGLVGMLALPPSRWRRRFAADWDAESGRLVIVGVPFREVRL